MTDLSPKIFELWTLERELREAGKWPEGAPGLGIFDWDWSKTEGHWFGCGELWNCRLIDNEPDAALWRIMQLVAWWSWHRSELLEKHVNESYWFAATPADWITAAKKILEGWG